MIENSSHFTYHQLGEGVWAAIVISSGLAASNSAIIDLGGEALIFDTTFSPASAEELKKAAESLPGVRALHVVNSHWHSDHVFGNAVFSVESKIYSTEHTRKLIAENTPNKIVEFKQYWPQQLKEWAESAKQAKDEVEKIDYEDSIRFAQAIINTFPKVELRLPDTTFTDKLVFEGTKHKTELLTFGGGHTESDALLYLPSERIVIMGDLLVVKNHPDLTSGNPRTWLEILSKVKALDPVKLVPGHGELATLADIETLERYLNELLQMAEQSGDKSEFEPPSFAKDWDNADAFPRNMDFLRGLI